MNTVSDDNIIFNKTKRTKPKADDKTHYLADECIKSSEYEDAPKKGRANVAGSEDGGRMLG